MSIGSQAELALGTAQFGLAYGLAGRGEMVLERDVRAILERAADRGVRRLDTAAAYGTIEARLSPIAEGLDFDVISKIPAVPADLDLSSTREFVSRALDQSLDNLGGLLRGMLFHRSEDLSGDRGAMAWEVASRWGERHGVAIGVSCYESTTLAELRSRFPVAMAQLPGNVLDQRLAADAPALAGIEISLRSLFLQGLLLMPEADAARRLPAAAAALSRWHRWCQQRGWSPLVAAVAAAKGLPGVRFCVVGVDDVAQFDEIVDAWDAVRPTRAEAVATDDLAVIDPRRWELHA